MGCSRQDIEKQLQEHVSANNYLNHIQKQKLTSLLLMFSCLFIENPKNLLMAKLVSHVIDTGNAMPVRSKTRRLPPKWTKENEEQIQEMVSNGICRISNSPAMVQSGVAS